MRSLGLAAITVAFIVSHGFAMQTSAQAIAQTSAQMSAQTSAQTVSAGDAIPAGMVWVASQTMPQCGPRDNNAWVLSKLLTGGRIMVCGGQAIPASWVKTRTATGAACKLPSASPLPPQSHSAWELSALAGGSTATVCADQALPAGWLRTGTQTTPGQCMAPGESGTGASHNQWTVADSAGNTGSNR